MTELEPSRHYLLRIQSRRLKGNLGGWSMCVVNHKLYIQVLKYLFRIVELSTLN